jgi:hypothetical protein
VAWKVSPELLSGAEEKRVAGASREAGDPVLMTVVKKIRPSFRNELLSLIRIMIKHEPRESHSWLSSFLRAP